MPFEPTDYLPYDFANRRHIGPSPAEMEEMLATCGVADLDELIEQTVPKGIRREEPLDFGTPLSERGALDRMRATAGKNKVLTSLIGLGLDNAGYQEFRFDEEIAPPGADSFQVRFQVSAGAVPDIANGLYVDDVSFVPTGTSANVRRPSLSALTQCSSRSASYQQKPLGLSSMIT